MVELRVTGIAAVLEPSAAAEAATELAGFLVATAGGALAGDWCRGRCCRRRTLVDVCLSKVLPTFIAPGYHFAVVHKSVISKPAAQAISLYTLTAARLALLAQRLRLG